MSELLPSFIVLGTLLITFGVLIKRATNKKAATIVNCLLMAILCFIGGLLVSAMYTRAIGNDSAEPMVIAVLVLIGTFSGLAIYIKLDNKQKLNKAE